MKNPNFNQLTKTIALSLILTIVSGFGNSINAQTPQPCPTQNIDVNQLKNTLSKRYANFDQSLHLLLTLLGNDDIPLYGIITADQISKLGDIYQCVLPEQDNANLGTLEQRLEIRQTITEISAILRPAIDGFTEETITTLKTNLKIDDSNLPSGDNDQFILLSNEIEENLNNLKSQLNSQIQALANSTPPPDYVPKPTDPDEDSFLPIFGALMILLGIALGGVTYELLLLRNRQRISTGNTKTEDQKQTIPLAIETSSSINSTWIENQVTDLRDLSQKYQELAAKVESIETHLKEMQQSPVTLTSTISPELPVTSIPDEINLTPEVQQILHLYHNRYRDLENSSIGVSQDPDNYSKRLGSGTNIPVILARNPNNKFLIVDDCYLVPKSGLNITTIIKQTIDDIFECQSFYASSSFKVIQPAIVVAIQGDRWQVTQKGVLQF